MAPLEVPGKKNQSTETDVGPREQICELVFVSTDPWDNDSNLNYKTITKVTLICQTGKENPEWHYPPRMEMLIM